MVRLLRKQGAAGEACDRTGPQHQGEPELGHTGATGERLKFNCGQPRFLAVNITGG
jgi:hypothetical protein